MIPRISSGLQTTRLAPTGLRLILIRPGVAQTTCLLFVELMDLPALLLARPTIGLHTHGASLAHRRSLLAASDTFFRLAVQQLGLGRAATDAG